MYGRHARYLIIIIIIKNVQNDVAFFKLLKNSAKSVCLCVYLGNPAVCCLG